MRATTCGSGTCSATRDDRVTVRICASLRDYVETDAGAVGRRAAHERRRGGRRRARVTVAGAPRPAYPQAMERVWTSRLRWRLRGAWLAPLLVVLTAADTLLLHLRPIAGDGATEPVAGLLLASFLNLVAIAALAPIGGIALRRARPDLPKVVARNYAGAALVAAVTAGLLIGGLLHHDSVVRNRAALGDAHARGQAWIGTHAPAAFRRHVELADTIEIVAGRVYRTCAPALRAERAWCVVVRAGVPDPGGIRPDGGTPNALFEAGMR